jgi:chromate transporter
MQQGSPLEVFRAFLKLGLSSFGGPIAHIGYFRQEFVVRRRWLDDAAFSHLLALCQFLPGPASSQLGFSVGLDRAGYLGGVAAWLGFTLPSALVMTAFAFGVDASDARASGALHGLKLVAVAVVAQAVLGMSRTVCRDPRRAAIAVFVLAQMLWTSSSLSQIAAMASGAALGLWLCREPASFVAAPRGAKFSHAVGFGSLGAFALLLVGLPLFARATSSSGAGFFAAFYHAGALVFGGGHVVLPLLQDAVVAPGWVSESTFLAGYGAAQAVPGPLFSFAAYLGAAAGHEPHGALGALVALVAIFLPGLLLVVGILPFWERLSALGGARAIMRGTEAAVLGILSAALYSPLSTSAVGDAIDVLAAVVGFLLLAAWRTPPIFVVFAGALFGASRAMLRV